MDRLIESELRLAMSEFGLAFPDDEHEALLIEELEGFRTTAAKNTGGICKIDTIDAADRELVLQ